MSFEAKEFYARTKVHARVELLNNHSSGNGDAISTLIYVHIFFFALLYSSWNQLLLFSSRDLFLKEYKQNKFFFFFLYFFLSLNCSLYSTYRLCWWEKMCLLTIYYSSYSISLPFSLVIFRFLPQDIVRSAFSLFYRAVLFFFKK